jgi:hypothetical protein
VEPGQGREGEVQKRLEGSEGEVILLRLARAIAARPIVRRSCHPMLVASLLIGSPPLLVVLIELAGGRSVSWFIWGTATVYWLLIAVMVLGAADAWQQVLRLGSDLDSMLEEADQQAVARWLSWALRWWPQTLALVLGIAASSLVGGKLATPLGAYADHGGLGYRVTIGWTGGVGALSAYWLWNAPALFYPLSHVERPKLDWVVPLQTPAVQKASRLTVTTSRLSTLGLLLFMLPIAATVVLASGELAVWILSVAPVVFAGITVVASSLIPQFILQDLLRRGRRTTLAEINAFLPGPAEVFRGLRPQQMQAVALYQSIANSSVSTLDWKRFVEYLLLLLAAFVPLVIALINSLGP